MKKQNETRYIVTSVASIPVCKVGSKTETYREATKPGWGTVEWYSAEDGYKNPVFRDRSDKTQQLACDEDCSASLYTKSGSYFGIFPYDEINVKEMPKQAECAAIINSNSCGYNFWTQDGAIRIFVTYDENGLIDNYRLEYGEDEKPYDGETEITFEDLFEQPEGDWRETYRAELPGTVEYQFKQEADKLAQESGETWMDDEQREQFRQVCGKIDRIKSALDFLCTMQLLRYDYDKKIINAARKFKKCLNFAQYEQPQEVARREEFLEEYKKYDLVMADATGTEAVIAAAALMASAPNTSKAAPVAADTTLTEEEVKFFNDTVAKVKYSVNVRVPIEPMDHEQLTGKSKEALGVCWAEYDEAGKLVPFRITIDEFFIHECFVALEKPYMKIEPQTLEQVIAHEIAHLHQWRHGKKHTALTEHICRLIEKGEPHGLEDSSAAPVQEAGQVTMAAMQPTAAGPQNHAAKVREARELLNSTAPEKLAYIMEAHEAYVTEAARTNDELDFIGSPEQVKLDFLIIAVTETRMSEEEFEEIWKAVDIISVWNTEC